MNKYEQLDKLRESLNNETNWPTIYMFKFIVLANDNSKEIVISKFSDEATITHKTSSNGKYYSITIKEVMLDANEVIEKYKAMQEIKGLMAL